MSDLKGAVKRAMELYNNGNKNYTSIARILNQEGYKTAKGYVFKRGYVSNLISYSRRGIDPLKANKRNLARIKKKPQTVSKDDRLSLVELICSSNLDEGAKLSTIKAVLGGENA